MRLASDARERKQEHLVTGSVNTCHQRLQCIAWGEMSCLSSGHLTTTRLKNVTSDRAYIFHSWPFYFRLVKKKKTVVYNSDQAQIFVRESEEASKSSEANSFFFSRLLKVLALFTLTPTFHSDDSAHLWPTQDIDVSQSSGNEGAVKHLQKKIL